MTSVNLQRTKRSRRHHLVAQGYQRAWTAGTKRILLVSKASCSARFVGTADAFVVPNLLTFKTEDGPSDALEVEFGRVESEALPDVRRWVDGIRDRKTELAVRRIVALHWARSDSITSLQRQIFEAVVGELVDASEDDGDYRRAFVESFDREPTAGELSALTEQHARAWQAQNGLFVERVQHNYNTALRHFVQLHSQRASLREGGRQEFVFADSPVVLTAGLAGLHGTGDKPIPLMQTENMWCPLSPFVGVSFATEPKSDVVVTPVLAQHLNSQSWRYASRYLGARPGANLDRLLARPPGTFDVEQPNSGRRSRHPEDP